MRIFSLFLIPLILYSSDASYLLEALPSIGGELSVYGSDSDGEPIVDSNPMAEQEQRRREKREMLQGSGESEGTDLKEQLKNPSLKVNIAF